MTKIAIIGGGLSGLTTAFYLNQADPTIEWHLYEASPRFGGHIQTVHQQGYVIEKGPDSFLARKPAGMQLIKDLGLTNQLVANATGQSYICHHGHFYPIPEGAVMGIPTKIGPFLKSPLFTVRGKLRVLYELIKRSEPRVGDQSLGAFFEQRFGEEMVNRLIEPLFSGIYAGDLKQMSLRTTYPAMEQLLDTHGSLLKGLRKQQKQFVTTGTKKTTGAFRTLSGGMIQLINTLVAQLPPERLQANQGIERVSELPNQRYQLTFVDGSQTSVDEVVFAITQPQVARLLPELNSPLAGQTVSSSATVSLGYRQSEIPSLPEGTGFLMTRAKAEQMTACTWVHTKWPHMVPKGRVLLRIFLGRSDQPNISRMSDSELIVLAQQQASALMGITASPEVVEVSKMSETMPQYAVNHHMRVEQLRQQTAGKHLHFIGMSYEGVGMPDCIRLAKECADNLKNK